MPIADFKALRMKNFSSKNIIALKNLLYLSLLKNQTNYYEQS